MFRGPGVNEYNWDTWINMINKMERDIKQTVLLTDQIMAMKESREYNQGLEHIKTKAILFSNGLSKITDYQDETTIINSQSQLLELIGAYHNLIVSANHVLGTI